jgi:hypothetical protein
MPMPPPIKALSPAKRAKQISEMHGRERREPPQRLRAGGGGEVGKTKGHTTDFAEEEVPASSTVDQGPALSCSWKHRRMWAAWKQRSWRW